MRIPAGAILAATLLVTNAFAADSAGPLAPGKPAGVKQAQNQDNTIWYVLGGAVVIGGIVLLATDNGGNNSGAPSQGATGGTSGSNP